ncbi:MAG TPA: aldehyde dehydrogenase family protein [Anaerovoracaceae bacterium]|nr:aldehyde dehydrogenase family protein [Anaerovoracaceae bacterium]
MKQFQLMINNQWVDAENGKTFISYNPCNGEPIAELAYASKNDVLLATKAAHDAFKSGVWSDLDVDVRSAYLHHVADIMESRFEELCKWEAMDTGKPIHECRTVDIPLSIRAFRFHADSMKSIRGQVITIPGREKFDYVTYEPYGVVACISPWNFPLHLLTRSICPALAAGNTVVCKASTLTPVTAQLLGEIMIEAGVPAGVYNAVSGAGSIVGEAFLASDDVDVVTLTGSEEVGRRLMEASSQAKRIKKLVLELGGKSASIVEPDCHLEGAINGVTLGFCMNQGEVCCSTSRLLLADEIYEQFIEALISKIQKIRIGDSLDETTQMGALIDKQQQKKVEQYIKQAVDQGARIRCGGYSLTEPPYDRGVYFVPTIIDNVTPEMNIFHEEVFGPVLAVTRYQTLEEAIELANATNFGLGAAIFSENPRKLFSTARKLDAGTIWMNTSAMSNIESPFGGNKNSGIGREDGVEGLMEYLKVKNHIMYIGDPYFDLFA